MLAWASSRHADRQIATLSPPNRVRCSFNNGLFRKNCELFTGIHTHHDAQVGNSRLGCATPAAARGRRAIGCEQAVPQTQAAKRHYAGNSCRGGTGVPKKRGCVFWGAPQTRPPSAFTVCEVDPSIAVRTSIQQLITLSQRACGTRAGLKPAPTSFATAMCFPSGVCGTLVIRDCPARARRSLFAGSPATGPCTGRGCDCAYTGALRSPSGPPLPPWPIPGSRAHAAHRFHRPHCNARPRD